MRIVVAGSGPRMGFALAKALARRGHDVAMSDRPEPRDTGRAEAVVLVGDPDAPALDLDRTLDAVDAASAARARPALVRLSALGGQDAAEDEAIVVRAGRAQLRDLRNGIPEARTFARLPDTDRAFRQACVARDLHGVVLRAAELVSADRSQFGIADLVSRALVDAATHVSPTSHVDGASTFDVIDSAALAAAVETLAERASELAGDVLHLSGGATGRITLAAIHDAIGAAVKVTSAGHLVAHLLDDAQSRRRVSLPVTDAAAAIAATYRDLPRRPAAMRM